MTSLFIIGLLMAGTVWMTCHLLRSLNPAVIQSAYTDYHFKSKCQDIFLAGCSFLQARNQPRICQCLFQPAAELPALS